MSLQSASDRWRKANLCAFCVKSQSKKCKKCSYKKRGFNTLFRACERISNKFNIELFNLVGAKDEIKYMKPCGCERVQLRDSLRTNGPLRCQHDGIELWRFFENKVREFLKLEPGFIFFRGQRLLFDGASDLKVVEIKLNRSALMLEQGVRAWRRIAQYLEYSKASKKEFVIFVGEEIPRAMIPVGLAKYLYGPKRWRELGLTEDEIRYLLDIKFHWIQSKTESNRNASTLKKKLRKFLQNNANRLPTNEQSLLEFGIPLKALYSDLGAGRSLKTSDMEKLLGVDGIKPAIKTRLNEVLKKIEPHIRAGRLPSEPECITLSGVSHYQLQSALGFPTKKRVVLNELCKRLSEVFGFEIAGVGRAHALRGYNLVRDIKFRDRIKSQTIPKFKVLVRELGFLPTPELTKKLLGIDRITLFRNLGVGTSASVVAKKFGTVDLGKSGSLVGLLKVDGKLWTTKGLASKFGYNANYFGTFIMRNGPFAIGENFSIQGKQLSYFGKLSELSRFVRVNSKGNIMVSKPYTKKSFPINFG